MKDALAMSNQLFQTRNGIISYLIEEDSDSVHLHSSYLLIDLETKNLTQILSSLPESCGQEISIFNKLHYHAATYSLIYYCSNNNTLIILDEDDYNVQQTIPLNVTEAFQEVRMTTDGYSIAILGLKGLLNTNPAPTHLFKVSMLSRKVVNHVIFDHSLNSGEAVTAYASNGNGFYVLTNTINGPSPLLDNMTIYSMTLIANSYKLTQLANFSATIAGYNVVNELYCVENLIVTNNYLSVIIMNDEGSILQEIQGLGIEAQTEGIFNLMQPQLLSEYGSSDFYALWDNSTISKFSAHKQGYTSEFIGLGVSFQIAAKDQDSNSLLFTINRNYSVDSFTITDLNTLETVYQALMNPTQVMLTPVTYCQAFIGARGMQFFIFDLQTDALLTHLSTGTRNAWYYYYDQENYIFFYLELVQSDLSFQLVQIDFQTGNTYNVSTNLTSDSQPVLIHATNNANFNALQFVISTQTAEEYKYLIMSQAYGEIVAFTPPNSSEVSTLIVNYDTLSVYHFYSTYAVMAEMYSYDSATKNFTLEKSVNYTNNTGFYQSISFGPGHAVVYSEGYISIGVIDVQSLELVTYSVPFSWMTISIFQGSSNGIRFILSANGTSPATLFDNGTVQPLPESANYTVLREAGVAGVCSYWVENEIPQNVVVLDIFDICSEDSVYNSIISI